MIAEIVATAARLLSGCRPRWLDEPPAPGPRVYYANHASHLDALVIWASLPSACRKRCRIVAAADFWNGNGLRRWLAKDVFRALLIERKKVTRANNPAEAMSEVLTCGDALIIFPEGGRGSGNAVESFRGGLWHLARRHPGLEFSPVWLENLNRILPKGEVLPVPLISAVTFGKSFQCDMQQGKDQFLDSARNALLKLREHE